MQRPPSGSVRRPPRMGYRTNPPARALSTGRSSMVALVIPDVTNPSTSTSSAAPRRRPPRPATPCCSPTSRRRPAGARGDRPGGPAVEGLVSAARECRTRRSGCSPSRGRWSCSTGAYRCPASSPTTPEVCVGPSSISPSSATRPSPTSRDRRHVGRRDALAAPSWRRAGARAPGPPRRALRADRRRSPPRRRRARPADHAVIAYNDVMAIGVIKGIRRAGVRVPDDSQRHRLRQHLRLGDRRPRR